LAAECLGERRPDDTLRPPDGGRLNSYRKKINIIIMSLFGKLFHISLIFEMKNDLFFELVTLYLIVNNVKLFYTHHIN